MEKRNPPAVVLQYADRLGIQSAAPEVSPWGGSPAVRPFEWWYAGRAVLSYAASHVAILCGHTATAVTFHETPVRMTTATMGEMHADEWRVRRNPIRRPPKPLYLQGHQFTTDGRTMFTVYVGQCPDCGRIIWMDA